MNPNDFDRKFTVEFNGSKGWEVGYETNSLTDAVNYWRAAVLDPSNYDTQFRLTSPKV